MTTKSSIQLRALIEPGVLPVLRWTMLILWGLYTLAACGALNQPDPLPDHYFAILSWLMTGSLALYLSLRPLRRWLKAAFISLALLVAALGPITNVFLANLLYFGNGGLDTTVALNGDQLFLWLIPPLLLISTQYSTRAMLLFVAGTSLYSITLAILESAWLALPADEDINAAVLRLFMFGFTGYIVTRISNAQRTQRTELAAKNAQLVDYASTLEQLAVTRERNRLAREMHDTLAHTLSAIDVQLKALEVLMKSDPAAAQEQLRETREITGRGLHEARRALHDLRAQPVEEFGLLLALARVAQQAAERTESRLVLKLPPEITGLSPQTQQQLYRITEEALNNVIRHANASTFWVTLKRQAGCYELAIKDNGEGFDTASIPEGRYGLQGIRERAQLIGAAVTLQSKPGKGTLLEVTVGENA